jgi:hypothetical protein
MPVQRQRDKAREPGVRRRADVARLPPLGYGEAPLDYPNRDNVGESNDEATGEPACTARSMLLVLFAAGVDAALLALDRRLHRAEDLAA